VKGDKKYVLNKEVSTVRTLNANSLSSLDHSKDKQITHPTVVAMYPIHRKSVHATLLLLLYDLCAPPVCSSSLSIEPRPTKLPYAYVRGKPIPYLTRRVPFTTYESIACYSTHDAISIFPYLEGLNVYQFSCMMSFSFLA
jgi:hypothetical protein